MINLDTSVNHRIAMLAVSLKRQAFRLISENKIAITPDQWVLLYYLWQDDGLQVGSLAAQSKKDFANTTRIIDKLVGLGYVEKRKSTTDSRITTIYLMPKADTIKQTVNKVWETSTEIAMQGISKTEQAFLLDLVDRMEQNVLAQDG